MFKEIPFTNGYYSCDEYGNIRSNTRTFIRSNGHPMTIHERILSPKTNNQGYYYVSLCFNNQIKDYLVHRLVAITWIPNPYNYPQINHIDRNPKNNYIHNLEWCTQSQNNYHIYYENRPGVGSKSVIMMDDCGNELREFASLSDASIHCIDNISGRANIAKACRTHGRMYGYKWKFK